MYTLDDGGGELRREREHLGEPLAVETELSQVGLQRGLERREWRVVHQGQERIDVIEDNVGLLYTGRQR